ncbi:xanthine dehydrogenase family protein molybdopterin-binding subunit [Alkaliphilus peptidifermentans]|uniref:Xanthine dehydrogenase, molybdenum binding subunit apoprotein n=1 Tax=Alkaliphilus peptidifermentans DSM 18978 TaxID=1120976 RepID=A0A1G5JW12_9FIRM|nr:molybdopterin cofactor-binding domain-containing protein [Alkaliphilus peptidifermentans]SCY92563.1 xanthine dehydrogenase, molybdenum binding subunit apoprotein [Alkaliphilus peptidifermentans DSM 18978]
MKTVNSSISKLDGMSLVTGKAAYTDDFAPKDALIVKVLRSPHAFARIKKIDTTIAEKVPGVACIFTHKNVIRKPFTRAGQCYPELSPYDKFLLDEYVRHVGDDVAIIAAIDEKTATKAMKLIKVEYDVLKPVLDLREAENSNPVHPEEDIFTKLEVGFNRQKNIVAKIDFSLGDIDEALASSEIVIKRNYSTQAQAQGMMETQRTYTYLDNYGRLVVVTSTQIPFHVRRILANALDIPMSKIRVIKPRIGGGFGSKQTAQSEFYPALVTLETGKPAKIVYSRKEVFIGTTSRHAMTFDITIGADRKGKIKAIDMEGLWDTGAYGEHAQTTLGAAGKKVLTLYNKVDACRFNGKALYTNHVPGGALRGFGVTQGTFALESAINELAKELDIDPIKLREINMIKKGETTPLYNIVTKGAGNDPMYMDSCLLEYCVNRGKELISWNAKYPKRVISSTKVRGMGMAISQQGSGLPNIDMASATLKLNDDGFFTLLLGATDIGTGSDTILCQIAAEALNVDIDKIIVYASDTDITPFDSGAYASSTTYTTGNAVIDAAEKMKDLIISYGAKYFETVDENIAFDGSNIIRKDNNEKISLVEFSKKITYNMLFTQLVATGSFVPKKAAPPYMAGFAEVEVDLETGKVDVIDFIGVVDCGTPINPKLAKVQAEGGIVQGIGLALYEEVKYTNEGRLINNTFMEYKMPTRMDTGNIYVELADGYDETGPYGAKSIGEVVINTVAPAITEAIYNACGVRIRDLPATPEKVLLQL